MLVQVALVFLLTLPGLRLPVVVVEAAETEAVALLQAAQVAADGAVRTLRSTHPELLIRVAVAVAASRPDLVQVPEAAVQALLLSATR
jgi:hypothetical protein